MNATTEQMTETELKARAWDVLMSSKHPRCDDAVMDAWQWLKAAKAAAACGDPLYRDGKLIGHCAEVRCTEHDHENARITPLPRAEGEN